MVVRVRERVRVRFLVLRNVEINSKVSINGYRHIASACVRVGGWVGVRACLLAVSAPSQSLCCMESRYACESAWSCGGVVARVCARVLCERKCEREMSRLH